MLSLNWESEIPFLFCFSAAEIPNIPIMWAPERGKQHLQSHPIISKLILCQYFFAFLIIIRNSFQTHFSHLFDFLVDSHIFVLQEGPMASPSARVRLICCFHLCAILLWIFMVHSDQMILPEGEHLDSWDCFTHGILSC